MRRGKPQQEIYRPGSGPLRKSNTGTEESELEPNLSRSKPYQDVNAANADPNAQRKPRKPEQVLYVPRAVANAREMQEERFSTSNGNCDPRSKRYSNRRRGPDENPDDEWRQARHGSEPRGMPNGQRMRDTRSVEPSAHPIPRNYEKSYSKPPSGRRHSTIGLECDKRPHKITMPPRFQKKKLEENKLNQSMDDNWNGASLTFQGSNNYQNNYSYSNMGYSTLPNRHRGRGRLLQEYEPATYNNRSRTPDMGITSPCNSRPPTPPYTRTRSNDNLNSRNNDNWHTRSNDYLNRLESRSQSPANNGRNYDYRRNRRDRSNRRNQFINRTTRDDSNNQNYEVQEENWDEIDGRTTDSPKEEPDESPSQVSPPTIDETPFIKPSAVLLNSNTVLDWSEEVELNERLEAEALSDTMTRSSSVASLVEIGIKSMPPTLTNPKKSRKHSGRRYKRRSGSRPRDSSLGPQPDPLKQPQESRGRRNRCRSRDHRDSSYPSRDPSCDLNRRDSTTEPENWRDEIRSRQNSEREYSDRSRRNSERDDKINVKKAGVLVLPQKSPDAIHIDQPKYPEVRKPCQQKSLFDHNNPSRPIIVKSQSSRVGVPGFSDNAEEVPPQMYTTDQFGNIRPGWYDDSSEGFNSCHYPNLIKDIKRVDNELQCIVNSGMILINWGTAESLRDFLKEALKYLLCKDLKFCQTENVEQHLWKILYHNIIEITRKTITNDPANKEQYKGFVFYLIDEGSSYLESLLEALEETYKFKLNNYLGTNSTTHLRGLGYIGLALISAQKLLLFLGDLGRYREQVNESSNYGKCRQWYIKAHEINPKNGKPYNQLAVLAMYARRKLDAVYYYMRSLMSSNPVPSAKESLTNLFYDNRKKYEQGERKRREERLERAKQHMKQKESEDLENAPGALRHETWIRPGGGRRVHRTTQAVQEQKDSEEEDLAMLSSVEVNKRFVISYLHVHGKLITKIGMESFQEAAMQMLKEFRALLQHSPVPLNSNRFLQLLALNMFAIESTQLKDPQLQMQAGYRSELQERALVVSLQMFNLILERCVSLLQEGNCDQVNSLPQDLHVLLPPVKIWCDWMLCHSAIWNPPPSTQDFKVGTPGDTWTRLATLMNLLEKMDQTAALGLISEYREGYEQVKLPEDSVLSGFTPLMVNEPDVSYAPKDFDVEVAQFSLRISKLLFFGTVFLCGLEPPVLKLEIEDDFREYVSVVCTSNSRDSPVAAQDLVLNNDVLMESFSDEEEEDDLQNGPGDEAPSEVRELLWRKVELERTQRQQELHKQRVKKILSQAVVSVHIEVRPKYLVPDTNCFIDHLDRIASVAASHVYTLMVPIVVLSELEGLSRGGKSPAPSTRSSLDPQHVKKVAQAAKDALVFLKSRPPAVKCVTTKGAVLCSTTFTSEDDSTLGGSFKNDDKILATCLVLSKGHRDQQAAEMVAGGPKKLVSEVVLLTDDRNLRVKALARDVPVRELVDFMQWAGLG